jgi:uracil-DNA glycosylase
MRSAAERRTELLELYQQLKDCRDCPLAESRTNLVFGSGNADADLMFVGEAPGVNEDRQGRPFVGQAGKLLDQLLGEIGLEREDAFITNVLLCRPPGNRDPLPEEIEECTPHLMRRIELIQPRVICTLGNFATKLLTGKPDGIMRVHGRPQTRTIGEHTVVLYPICHPAAALYTPAMLDGLREDFARLPRLIEESARMPHSPAADLAEALEPPDDAPRRAEAPDREREAEPAQLDLFA